MIRAVLFMLLAATNACAGSVELGGSGTVFSHKSIIETGIVSLALVTGEAGRFPGMDGRLPARAEPPKPRP